MEKTAFTPLADRFRSDKGMIRAPHHGYTFVYDMLFQSMRDKPVSILELGLARTSEDFRGRSEMRSCALSPSVEMWLGYFNKAHVTGFDLSDFSQHKDPDFTFVQGDLGKEPDYQRILEASSGFDIVVDDGSHASFHQMLAFSSLFGAVHNEGFYIIEDAWSQPAVIEKRFPTSHTIAHLFREFLRLGYFPECSPVPASAFNRYIEHINNILFIPYHNEQGGSDQLLVIHKRVDSRFDRYRSKVRFYRNLPGEDDRVSLQGHIGLCPENPYPYYHLARLDYGCGNHALALENIQRANRLADDDADIALLMVKLMFDSGKQAEAVATALENMSDRVASEVIGVGFAEFLVDAGAFTEAGAVLKRLHDMAPDSSRCQYLLGSVEEASKCWQAAADYYRRAFEMLPGRLAYLKAYARVARKIKSPGLVEYLQEQGEYFGDSPGYHVLLANVYLVYGKRQDALQIAQDLLQHADKADWARTFISKHSAGQQQ